MLLDLYSLRHFPNHDAFMWWGTIIIPAIAVLASTAVAIAAWRASASALKIAKDTKAEEDVRRREADRREVQRVVRSILDHSVAEIEAGRSKKHKEHWQEEHVFVSGINQPNSEKIIPWLDHGIELLEMNASDLQYRDAMIRVIKNEVALWAGDPESVEFLPLT